MTTVQAWLLFGVPFLVTGAALFYGRSRARTVLGYLVLLAGFGVMAAFSRASAGLFAGLVALLYAAGRGGSAEAEDSNTSLIAVPDEVRRSARHSTS